MRVPSEAAPLLVVLIVRVASPAPPMSRLWAWSCPYPCVNVAPACTVTWASLDSAIVKWASSPSSTCVWSALMVAVGRGLFLVRASRAVDHWLPPAEFTAFTWTS